MRYGAVLISLVSQAYGQMYECISEFVVVWNNNLKIHENIALLLHRCVRFDTSFVPPLFHSKMCSVDFDVCVKLLHDLHELRLVGKLTKVIPLVVFHPVWR